MGKPRFSEMHLVVDSTGQHPFARSVDDALGSASHRFGQFTPNDAVDTLPVDDDRTRKPFAVVYDCAVFDNRFAHVEW